MKKIIQGIFKGCLPQKATPGSASVDLTSSNKKNILIPAGGRASIPTGVYLEVPRDMVGHVCSRSGMALASGVIVLNAPGIIDPDYRGEIMVILANLSTVTYTVKPRQRIAQLLFYTFISPHFINITKLSETERNNKGFGSNSEKVIVIQ